MNEINEIQELVETKEEVQDQGFQPFLGRMKIEVILEDLKEHIKKKMAKETGVSAEFLGKLELVRGETIADEYGQKQFQLSKERLPITKGKIIEMSPDCFGKAFQDRFGNDRDYPQIGDTVVFITNKSYPLDAENKFHIVDDCEIVAWKKNRG